MTVEHCLLAASAAALLIGGLHCRRLRAALATATQRGRAPCINELVASSSLVKPLEGRVVLITGAGVGIGRAIALALAHAGAIVVLNDIVAQTVEETAAQVRELGGCASVVLADVSDERSGTIMVAHATEQYGRLDCVVANAASSERGPLVEQDASDTLRTIEVVQLGVLHTLKAAAKAMQRQPVVDARESRGRMVIVSSIMGNIVLSHKAAAYSMSKAAIRHLGACLASELIADRINVNTICPGWIDTPGERKFTTEADMQRLGRQLPWGRLGKPSEIGKAVVFLCSDDATFITGSTLVVDGGETVSMRLPCFASAHGSA